MLRLPVTVRFAGALATAHPPSTRRRCRPPPRRRRAAVAVRCLASAAPPLPAAATSPPAAPPLVVAFPTFRLPTPAEVATGPAMLGRPVLCYYADDCWVGGMVARCDSDPGVLARGPGRPWVGAGRRDGRLAAPRAGWPLGPAVPDWPLGPASRPVANGIGPSSQPQSALAARGQGMSECLANPRRSSAEITSARLEKGWIK